MRQRASPGGHGRTQLQKLRHSPSASTTSASPTSPTATRSKVKLRRKSKTKPATSMYLVHPGLAGGTSTLSPPPPAVVGARKPRRRSFQQQLAQPGSSTRLDFSSSGNVQTAPSAIVVPHQLSNNRQFLEEIRSRKSFQKHKQGGWGNTGAHKVEKWSKESHSKVVAEQERLHSVVQIERNARALYNRVQEIKKSGVEVGSEGRVAERIESAIEVLATRRGVPGSHPQVKQAALEAADLRRVVLERTEQARADHEAALFECIGRGDLDGLTRLIVSEGTDPNARDASGKRALEVAALTRNADIVEALCDSGASLTIPNRNLEEKASGNEASEEQTSTTPDSPVEQSRIVVELVANLPAKVDQTSKEFLDVVRIVELLLDNGAVQDQNGSMPTALAIAVDREYSALVKVLCQNETVGQVIDIPFRNQTCVCTAALRGDADALKLLIGAKADINMRTDEGQTPVFIAAAANFTECVYELSAAKADLNVAAEVGAPSNGGNDNTVSLKPIDVAALKGHTMAVKVLLEALCNPSSTSFQEASEASLEAELPANVSAQPEIAGTLGTTAIFAKRKSFSQIVAKIGAQNGCMHLAARIAAMAKNAKVANQQRQKSWSQVQSVFSHKSLAKLKQKQGISSSKRRNSAHGIVILNHVVRMVVRAREAKKKLRLQREAALVRPRPDVNFVQAMKNVVSSIKKGYQNMAGRSLMVAVADGIDREVSGHQLSAISARVKMVIGVMGAIVDCHDARGKTALFHAAAAGAAAMCTLLLSRKANVLQRARNGYSPLAVAAKNGHWDAVAVLSVHTRKLAHIFASEEPGFHEDGTPKARKVVEHGPISPLLEAVMSFRHNAKGKPCAAGVKLLLKTLAEVGDLYEDVFWNALKAAILLCRWRVVRVLLKWDSTCPATLSQARVGVCRKLAHELIAKLHDASLQHLLDVESTPVVKQVTATNVLEEDNIALRSWERLRELAFPTAPARLEVEKTSVAPRKDDPGHHDGSDDLIVGQGYADITLESDEDRSPLGASRHEAVATAKAAASRLPANAKSTASTDAFVGMAALRAWMLELAHSNSGEPYLIPDRYENNFQSLVALCYASLTAAGASSAAIRREAFLEWFRDLLEPHVLRTVAAVDRVTPQMLESMGMKACAKRALSTGATGLSFSLDDLHFAIQRNDVLQIIRIVARSGLGVDATYGTLAPNERHLAIDGSDDTFYTGLMIAACYDRGLAVHILLHLHADPNHQADDGCTALILCAYQNHVEALTALLQGTSATMPIEDLIGRATSGDCLDFNLSMPGGATAVALAAQQGNTAALLEMLRFRGENAVSDALLNNATEDGSTPLTLAMYGRHLETLDVLADVVDVNATNEYGIAPLPSAVHMGDEAVLARLLRSKADPNVGDIDDGTTPVFIAVLNDNAPILAMLLEAGGKSGEQDSVGGNTDAMTAAFCFHTAALRELHKQNKVFPNLRNRNGESVDDILWAYHRRKHVEDVIDLNRTLVLEQFPPAPEVQNSRDFFLSSSLGAETVSDIQFTVMLAQLGLKVIYGDDFENFCATQFQRLDRSGNGAGVHVDDFVESAELFYFIVAARKAAEAAEVDVNQGQS